MADAAAQDASRSLMDSPEAEIPDMSPCPGATRGCCGTSRSEADMDASWAPGQQS